MSRWAWGGLAYFSPNQSSELLQTIVKIFSCHLFAPCLGLGWIFVHHQQGCRLNSFFPSAHAVAKRQMPTQASGWVKTAFNAFFAVFTSFLPSDCLTGLGRLTPGTFQLSWELLSLGSKLLFSCTLHVWNCPKNEMCPHRFQSAQETISNRPKRQLWKIQSL